MARLLKENVKIPSVIPKKFHNFITDCYKEFNEDSSCENKKGYSWWVSVSGISTNDSSHTIHEATLAGVVEGLKKMKPCSCSECKKNK